MEQLIEKMRAVLNEILGIKKSLEAERSKVAEVGRKQENVAKRQAEDAVKLEEREVAVKPIEDIVAFKQAAEKVAKESNEGRIALEKERQAFNAFVKSEKDKIADRKKKVAEQEEFYNRERAALKVAQEELQKKITLIDSKAGILNKLTEKL